MRGRPRWPTVLGPVLWRPIHPATPAGSTGARRESEENDLALDDVFADLKQLLAGHASGLVVTVDQPGNYQLDAPRPIDPKKPPSAYFGGVRTGKRFVSYHLMPVYADPSLLEGVSPQLKKRMQGKSCFNFTKLDETSKTQLGELTRRAVQAYRARGLI